MVTASATMMIAFAPQAGGPAPAVSSYASPGLSRTTGSPLPAMTLTVNGRPTALAALRPAVLLLLPDTDAAETSAAVAEIRRLAERAGVRAYTVRGSGADIADPQGALRAAYHAGSFTAVLVRHDGVVSAVVRSSRPDKALADRIARLRPS
ncbi:hypothetical protein D5H75_21150 [Bailinhaonella thermotolerans]|uniref:DUF4174 domain-containing protein n=2 Tax=Bailinhaonella thermotolerans TaxID=1070861 RepID=A0A3A4BHT4_9ACTN|nr:hypothetical protein D5H75_21150 [Bailinhaonella thermotolerans]